MIEVAGIIAFIKTQAIARANAVIAVAGMEGALGTVVAGQENPVIAALSLGRLCASFHGLSALITMINSCETGISVVNIDNGYGAAPSGGADQPPGGWEPKKT